MIRGMWCETCHRIIGIGCACDLTFAEKAATIAIDTHALTEDDKQWREYDKRSGAEQRRREWGQKKITR